MRQTTTSRGLAHREIGTLRTDEPGSRIWGFRSSPTDFWRSDERGDTGVGLGSIGGCETFGERAGFGRRGGQTGVMRSRRVVAAALATTLLLAACGGGDGNDAVDAGEAGGSELPVAEDRLEVDPTSDVATNVLPDVVVNHVQAGNKVNLRNMAPADTAVLVWMWSPH